ncbi:O-methyltransferase [Aspergillus bombycis]|uniref:catechol O-methyltransferase n=1 Tax=Aspergillus bombycis TaxID=109264 RepID=A0A1F8A9U2_9EURO|nr:O-methyltransferase [Aspergillus bombycis]OGM48512.1 O-methyltransferase [Aspergillus bombycis]
MAPSIDLPTDFYKPEETVFCNDGREDQLLSFITNHPQLPQIRNSPEAVLAAIDEFGRTKDFLMNVGPHKGRLITDLIATDRPSTILEIGGYVGYSAIMFGHALRKAAATTGQTPRFLSLEMNPQFAAVSKALVAIAGLDDIVDIWVGPCRASLQRLAKGKTTTNTTATTTSSSSSSNSDSATEARDMLFLDHSKISYLNDLKLCEELGLVAPGSTVVADDMKRPGNPQYSEYVRASPATKTEACLPFQGCLSDGGISLGNPSLVYETTLVEGLEPTGLMDAVEISKCVGLVEAI